MQMAPGSAGHMLVQIRWPAALSGVGNKFLIRIALITTILSADTAESPSCTDTEIRRYISLPYWKRGRYARVSDTDTLGEWPIYAGYVPRAKASLRA